MIVAFAGRRIDAPGTTIPRFPLTQVAVVRGQIEELFIRDQVKILMCSAACGADLIALWVAKDLGIDFRIVLPFSPELFRVTSVMDCPGTERWNWGVVFDQVLSVAKGKGEVVVIETDDDRHTGYQAVNHAILDAAIQKSQMQMNRPAAAILSPNHDVQAVIAWDGRARGPSDLTRHFAEEARSRGLVVKEIFTLGEWFNKERKIDVDSHA